ncbi:MAG: PQQ-binding-like beta-propeller repeat protein [Armatimonadota bacterium]|jgi:outer membrane protein assembly factor BamB
MNTSNEKGDRRLNHERVPSTVNRSQQQPSEAPAEVPPGSPPPSDRRRQIVTIAIPIVAALIGAFLLGMWLLGDRASVDVGPRAGEVTTPTPGAQDRPGGGMDDDVPDRPDGSEAGQPEQPADAQFTRPGQPGSPAGSGGPSRPSATPASPAASSGGGGSWPNFRGRGYDGIAQEASGLASSWPSGGPAKLWEERMLGPGHAGAAIANGRVYVLDYDRSARQDVLRCLSLTSGDEIWRHSYPVDIKDNHGISRTVPAVAGGYVVALGPMGHVTCARADSGDVVWQVDLKAAYGTKIPSWYAGQCPIIEDGKAIIAPGGRSLMIAVDIASGTVEWEAPNPDGWQMTHASVMPMQIGGRKVYVYPATGGLVGINAADGSIVFKYPGWTVNTANVPTPVPVGDERVFVTGGYGAGSMLLSVRGGTPAQVWKIPQTVFGSHQHTPILHQSHLFGVAMDRQLVCLNLQGQRVWESGHTVRFGIGPYLLADGKIYVLSDDGTLVMAQAGTSGYNELARAKVLPGPDAWAPMALADGKLVLRDRDTMICLDVRGR